MSFGPTRRRVSLTTCSIKQRSAPRCQTRRSARCSSLRSRPARQRMAKRARSTAATPEQIANAKEGEEPEPAPAVAILPVRKGGWNKFTVKSKLTDLTVFDDAEIVWAGDAAY